VRENAMAPTALFVAFQVLVLKLPGRRFRGILLGTALAAVGLFLFLLGVTSVFFPSVARSERHWVQTRQQENW
jgi:uncharacterized protein DUF1538